LVAVAVAAAPVTLLPAEVPEALEPLVELKAEVAVAVAPQLLRLELQPAEPAVLAAAAKYE
jgi:predicted secreted protein